MIIEWNNSARSAPREHQALDFKFTNRGGVAALMEEFTVHIVDVRPDDTPELWASRAVGAEEVEFFLSNAGWGPALSVKMTPKWWSVPEFREAIPRRYIVDRVGDDDDEEGEEVSIGKIRFSDFDPVVLADLLERKRERWRQLAITIRTLARGSTPAFDPASVDHPDNRLLGHGWIRKMREVISSKTGSRELDKIIASLEEPAHPTVPLRIDYELTFKGRDGTEHSQTIDEFGSAFSGWEDPWPSGRAWSSESDRVWVGESGFVDRSSFKIAAPAGIPFAERAYGVILPFEKGWERTYNLMHSLSPGEVENFYIILESERSATYTLEVTFLTNERQKIRSDRRQVHLHHSRESQHKISDGAILRRVNHRLSSRPRFIIDE